MSISSFILNRSLSRKKLLALFFENEDKEFYLREMAYLTDVPPSNVRRELKILEDDNFFITRRKANLLFYKLNKKHPLFNEIKKILSQEIGIEIELKRLFENLKDIEFAFIYGSFVSKKNRSDSDIDLMIVGSPDRQYVESRILEMEKKYQKEINYQIISIKNFKEKIKQKNSFILNLLKNKKIILRGDFCGL
jgi:predicted nucleotidyltransferase